MRLTKVIRLKLKIVYNTLGYIIAYIALTCLLITVARELIFLTP